MTRVTEDVVLAVHQKCGLWICRPGAGQGQNAGAGTDGGRGGRWLDSLIKSERLLVQEPLSEENLS